jgi:MFS-type transporter involved in bile tolerance (Atg22 family)
VLVDLLAIVIFALVGRASHAERADLLGLATTAWPFLGGWLLGALAARIWRRPAALSTGVIVWLGTLVGGMLLRVATHAGVQLSFVIVAGVVLAVFLVGWRAGYRLIRARVQPAPET